MSEKKKVYASIIDQILDDNTPSYEGLSDAKKNGDNLLSDIHSKTDKKFVEGIGGKSHHTPVPGGSGIVANQEDWRQKSAQVTDRVDSIVSSALKELEGEKTEGLEKKMLSDSDIQKKIDDMLHLGVSPKRVASMLEKYAELALFNKQRSFDYLDTRAGQMGIAYIEPNHFMKDGGSKGCVSSFEFIKKKGSLKALSVKKTASCASCSYRSCDRCNLYKLPIVASADQLRKVMVAAANKVSKTASIKEAMLALHNGQDLNQIKNVTVERGPLTIRTAGDKEVRESESFTSTKVASLVKEGKGVNQIFAEERAKYGSQIVLSAIQKYINELKKTGAKVDLNAIDCSLLKNKLATQNAIVGSSKCSSCSYRNGMHCGLTGGTLLHFPGMDKVKTQKSASSEVKADGNTLNSEYGMDNTRIPDAGTIEIGEPGFEDINIGSQMSAGEIE